MSAMVWKSVVPGLQVSECHQQGVVHVRLAGELDLATAPVALRVLLDAAGRSRTVAVDLAWVTFCDAFACGRLLEAHAAISAGGGELVVERVHPRVRRVLNLTNLGRVLTAASQDAATWTVPDARVVAVLDKTIDSALRQCRADMANAQLRDPGNGSLRIVSQRGFSHAFLNFFEVVHRADSACGVAVAEGRSVWVSDVSESRIFAGTPALDAMLAAGARSVATIPVERAGGELVGLFSVHRRQVGQWTEQQRRTLERIGRIAGQQLALT